MAQQQLLLLVLGIVVVGLAVVIGITMFDTNLTKSQADALVSDALRIASDAQAWATKPVQAGGGGGPDALASLGMDGFARLGFPTGVLGAYINPNGTFLLSTMHPCSSEPVIPSEKVPLIYIIAVSEVPGGGEPIGVGFTAVAAPAAAQVAVVCVGIAGTQGRDVGTVVEFQDSEGGGIMAAALPREIRRSGII